MNSPLVLALGFGIGVAGFAFAISLAPAGLVNRVGVIRNPRAASIKQSPIETLVWATRKIFPPKSNPRIQRALFELPEILDLLSVCLSSGDSIYRALCKVIPRAHGELAQELAKILRAVEFGAPLAKEIGNLSTALPHPQFSELASKISLSLTRGTPVSAMLLDQATTARSEIRNQLIRQAGKNETRMLIPLVFLILPVTVLFAVYPSLKLLNFNYF